VKTQAPFTLDFVKVYSPGNVKNGTRLDFVGPARMYEQYHLRRSRRAMEFRYNHYALPQLVQRFRRVWNAERTVVYRVHQEAR
jgi:hypothetical protein